MNTEDLHRNMIAFGEWIRAMGYKPKPWSMYWIPLHENSNEQYTTEQLFEIYLNEQNDHS